MHSHLVEQTIVAESDAAAVLNNIAKVIDGFLLSCRNDARYTVTFVSSGFEEIFGHDLKKFMIQGADYVGMLQTLRMLSFNARIEAAHSGAGSGFSAVAREMGDLATVGDHVAKSISLHLGRLRDVVRV